ncbi:MIP/aquaporin family protein [Jiulongibacter sediminis]|uniref:Glycerol transporter n=1 Tax=Jiulongibacter sediminis TaxID=1605367 RepID=A0A0N8H9T0_9BACT|nr:MIP/aquaporin family protein [Jiulongibacter sediminis]KPM48228.1 glycerol transporter [Jiulongibacter sediminis]TBX24771.1 glycerol transporter [Jiulongibacter sediminis]
METTNFIGELVGTFMLILLGGGVNANTSLSKTYGNSSGWIVTATGWGFAVAMAVFVAQKFGSDGAHLNPAVTIGLAVHAGDFTNAGSFILAQFIGAFLGATTVWLMYFPHWAATEDQGTKLGVFCTGPAIKNTPANIVSEVIGTFALIVGVMAIYAEASSGLKPFLVGVLVWSIGLSLGGTTGYAINPARDLGPRIAHAVWPIAGKGGNNWGYAWIPVVGPILGSIIAGFFMLAFGL